MTVTLREFIEEGLSNVQDNLRTATSDLTYEQLLWRPETAGNSIGFLLWHVARVEDNFIQRFILRGNELWEANGWQQKFVFQTRGIGTGFTQEQVEEVPIPSADVLWGYLNDTRAATLQYLSTLDWETLPEQPRPTLPQWSIQTIIRQLSAHANQHLGEVNYIRGLQGLPGALG